MSDIPDWLVELAAQRNQDADEGEPDVPPPQEPATFEPEGDTLDLMETLRSQVDDELPEDAPEPATRRGLFARGPRTQSAEPEQAPVGALVAAETALESKAEREPLPVRTIAGLLPWQQLVLAVFVFLDVAVIGFMFLVMLGRITLPVG